MTTPATPDPRIGSLSRLLSYGVAVAGAVVLIVVLIGAAGSVPGWLPVALVAVLACALVLADPLWPWTLGRWIAAGVALIAVVLLIVALVNAATAAVSLLALLVLIVALAVAVLIG